MRPTPVIPDDSLLFRDVRAPEADWSAIGDFALIFNAYQHWDSFERCAEIGNKAKHAYETSGTVPGFLTELRTCLFFEQLRWMHFGEEPDVEAFPYIRALVSAIRALVAGTGGG